MNPPSENDKLPDELDHAFTSLQSLVDLTQEVAGYLAKPPLPVDKPQPDRAQKFVDFFDQQRYCENLDPEVRRKCAHASRDTFIEGGHKSYFDLALSECRRFLVAFHALVEFAVGETVREWTLRNRSLIERLNHKFNSSGRDLWFYNRLQKVAGMQCPMALGSRMNGPYLVGRPNLDVAAKHFAKALQFAKNVDCVELPRFSPTLITDLRDELVRAANVGSADNTSNEASRSRLDAEVDAQVRLLALFTNGISDDRINRATLVLQDDSLSAESKLEKISALISFPPTTTAQQFADLVGVTKPAILKLQFWDDHKAQRTDSPSVRESKHIERGKAHEWERRHRDDN